ncbi:MAG: nicotinate (nicotinamide) nucleotide adenylyltransferase [Sulfurovum sp.]|nr:nicotinate (nicotinamide) nucleotide adenylyltransferase [Sulfurovum sp.]
MVNQSKPIVAIFGGSFDPPHQGHQAIVQKISNTLDIDTLIIVPAYLSPFKQSSCALATTRLKWCNTLFERLPKVKVDDYEIQEGKSTTTVQSVKYFNMIYTVKYLIIGSDNLSTLTKWQDFVWLNTHIIWVIITRQGYPITTARLQNWKIITLDVPISSSQIRSYQDISYIDKKIQKSVHHVLQGDNYMSIENRIENIVKTLDDNKAEEIEVFNLEEADYIAKHVIITNSLNGKHTMALAEHIKQALKGTQDSILASDMSDEWVVLDLGDILIHIMIPEYRQRYNLENFLSELLADQKKAKQA